MDIEVLQALSKEDLIHLIEGLQIDMCSQLSYWMMCQIERGEPCIECIQIAHKLGVAPQKKRATDG